MVKSLIDCVKEFKSTYEFNSIDLVQSAFVWLGQIHSVLLKHDLPALLAVS